MSAGYAAVGGNLPISVSLIVSKDVYVPVIGIDFEPALRRRKPAINDSAHFEAPRTEPERAGLLLSSVAGVTLDTNRHGTMIRLKLGKVGPGKKGLSDRERPGANQRAAASSQRFSESAPMLFIA